MTVATSEGPPARTASPRDHLLQVASKLFYENGITSVGVDRILAEAKTTRATLYRHFAGKEGLVQAYLENEDQIIRGYFEAGAREATSSTHLLELLVTGIADDATRYHTRGCPFINAAAEYSDSTSGVRKTVAIHRAWFRFALEDAFRQAERPNPKEAAERLALLRDAALVGSYLDGPEFVRPVFMRAAREVAGLG